MNRISMREGKEDAQRNKEIKTQKKKNGRQ